MDNLQLRQRIVRSMIRVSERTANMRKPEKFEYRKHMTAAFMDMLELCNANTNIGFRAALALFVYFLRAKTQQKHQGKRDAFPGRQGQRYTLVLLCRWRPPGTPSKPRRLAVVCYADRRQIRILWRGCHSGKISPRIVTRGPLL